MSSQKRLSSDAARRLTWMLLASASALLIVVGLSLALFHLQARAGRTAETTAAALNVQKLVNKNAAAPADRLTYTINIQKLGADTTPARLTDTLPAELAYVTGSLTATDELGSGIGTFGFENDVITWYEPSLAGDVYVTFSAQITSDLTYAEIINTAEVTGAGELVEDSASTVVVTEVGNLDTSYTTKGASAGEAEPGEILTYTIRIENNDSDHPHSVPDARLTDTLPTELTYVPASLSSLDPTAQLGVDNAVITWTNSLTYPSFDEISFSAVISSEVSPDSWITNTAEIVAPLQSFTRSASIYIRPDVHHVHFPLVFRRWPPVPYPPTLAEIDNQDGDVSYRVSWSYDESYPDETDPVTYTLQEASSSSFAAPRVYHPTSDPECGVSTSGGYCDLDNDSGTYHYRVRGHNSYGPGEWSEVKDVTVWGYEDDFSNYNSGWPRVWERTRGALYQVRPYEHPDCGSSKDCKYEDGDGYVIARRAQKKPRARFTPGVEVPSNNYELDVHTRWFEASLKATYEIFFSAEVDFDSYYAVKVRIDDPNRSSPRCSYMVYKQDGDDRDPLHDWDETDEIHCGVRYCDGDDSCGNTSWNDWEIRREGNKIRIKVNGKKLFESSDSEFGAYRYFGVGATNYEGLTPAKPEFDDFSVKIFD